MAPCPMISAIPTSPLLHQVLSLASGMAAINLIPGLIRLLPRAVSRCPPAVTQSLTYRECVITSAGVVALKERPDHVSLGRPGGASGATTPKSASAARGGRVGVGGRLACPRAVHRRLGFMALAPAFVCFAAASCFVLLLPEICSLCFSRFRIDLIALSCEGRRRGLPRLGSR